MGRLTQRLLGPASLGRAAAALERCCAYEAAFWATVLMESATSLDLSMEAGAHARPHMHARSSFAMWLTPQISSALRDHSGTPSPVCTGQKRAPHAQVFAQAAAASMLDRALCALPCAGTASP